MFDFPMSFWLSLSVTLNVILLVHVFVRFWAQNDQPTRCARCANVSARLYEASKLAEKIYEDLTEEQDIRKNEAPLPIGFVATSQDVPRDIILHFLGESKDKIDFLSSHEIFQVHYGRLIKAEKLLNTVAMMGICKESFPRQLESADDRTLQA